MDVSKLSGAELLRLIVRNLNACRESFLDEFTAEELLTIGKVRLACEWDFYPDQWEPRQVREALRGRVPTFKARTEEATYDTPDEVGGPGDTLEAEGSK